MICSRGELRTLTILWVIFGALWTRRRPWLALFHVLSLVWGIIVEIGPWPCPLTLAEQSFEAKASQHTWTGGFLVHCLDSTVYPNLPASVIIGFAVAVCTLNLGIYSWRFWQACHSHRE